MARELQMPKDFLRSAGDEQERRLLAREIEKDRGGCVQR